LAVSCRRIIRYLNAEIERMEKQLARHVEDQTEWTEKESLLKTVPGVGDTLVYTLLVIMTLLQKKYSVMTDIDNVFQLNAKINMRQ